MNHRNGEASGTGQEGPEKLGHDLAQGGGTLQRVCVFGAGGKNPETKQQLAAGSWAWGGGGGGGVPEERASGPPASHMHQASLSATWDAVLGELVFRPQRRGEKRCPLRQV